jgi:hypothetical protein
VVLSRIPLDLTTHRFFGRIFTAAKERIDAAQILLAPLIEARLEQKAKSGLDRDELPVRLDEKSGSNL